MKAKPRDPLEVDLNNVPLPKHDRHAGIALVEGIADSRHRVPDCDGYIGRNREGGIDSMRGIAPRFGILHGNGYLRGDVF